jgi:prepilin-type N-terminal cleavage/methylation domain-containing protein
MMTSINKAFRGFGRRLRPGDGFTLVELLVAMVLMLVIMAGIYAIWFGLQRTYSFTNDDMTAQEEARTALNELVEYIRTARQPDPAPSDELAVVIVAADANSLVCWTDVDRDANHDLELVRFRVDEDARTLYRDTSDTADPAFTGAHSVRMVGSWVSNNSEIPLFTYTSGNGTVLPTPVTDPTQIREVAIDLRIDVYTEEAPIAHQLRSVVQPRNLRQY